MLCYIIQNPYCDLNKIDKSRPADPYVQTLFQDLHLNATGEPLLEDTFFSRNDILEWARYNVFHWTLNPQKFVEQFYLEWLGFG